VKRVRLFARVVKAAWVRVAMRVLLSEVAFRLSCK
jgi:hypothetical protein